jgi:glucose-6-phosphate-specific signal transduction histidine kinase
MDGVLLAVTIKPFAHFLATHTWIMVVSGGLVLAPISFFFQDSLKHPERYKHK